MSIKRVKYGGPNDDLIGVYLADESTGEATAQPASLGQKTMAASSPVVIASDQTKVPVTGAVADGAAASGANPVLIGGQRNANGNLMTLNVESLANLLLDAAGAAGSGVSVKSYQVAQISTSGFSALRTPSVFKNIAAVAVTAATPVAAWDPASGKKFRLMGFALSLSVAGSVIIKDGANEILRTPLMAAGAGMVSPPMGNGILSTAADANLFIDVTASGSVSGFVYGTEE